MNNTATVTPDPEPEPFNILGCSHDLMFLRLRSLRENLIEKAEDLSIKLEANMNPGVAASLRGDDQRKAQHLFESQARKIEAELNKLMALAESFRVHIY